VIIDSSGNLLVGTTNTTLYSATSGGGILAIPNSSTTIARQSTSSTQPLLILNETGLDGTLQEFRKDGSIVGSIGSVTQSGATNLVLDSTSAVYFDTNVRPKTDNTYDVGSSSYRFKDLHLSGNINVGGSSVVDSNRRILAADGAENVPYITFAADTNTGLYRPGANTLGFSTAGSERMRINSSGKVGIGVSNPAALLEVIGSQDNNWAGRFENTNSGGYGVLAVTAGSTANDRAFEVRKNTSDVAMMILGDGKVGIGTTSPAYRLDIRNDVAASTDLDPAAVRLYNNSDGGSAILFENGVSGKSKISFGVEGTGASTDETYIAFETGANTSMSERMRIQSNGAVVIKPNGITTGLRLQGRSSDNNFYIQFKSNNGSSTYSSIGTDSGNLGLLYNSNIHRFNSTSSATEYMRITSSGNVGIQQDDPDSFNGSANQLVIGNSSGSRGITIRSGTSNSGNLFFSDGATGNQQYRGYIQYDHTNDRLNLGAGAADRIRITPSATVINEDSNDHDFRVESNSYTHALFVDAGADRLLIGKSNNVLGAAGHTFGLDGYLYHTRNGDIMWLNCLASSGTAITFMQNSGTKGSVTVNSTGTTYNTTSDRRLKDNIEPIADATDKLMDMKPVTHTWIDNPDEPQVHGFIAQEMQEVVPEAVSGDAESDEMMSMDYGRITPVIVAALQDALNEIKELKTRIDELENN
jgi:hypothetical protein